MITLALGNPIVFGEYRQRQRHPGLHNETFKGAAQSSLLWLRQILVFLLREAMITRPDCHNICWRLCAVREGLTISMPDCGWHKPGQSLSGAVRFFDYENAWLARYGMGWNGCSWNPFPTFGRSVGGREYTSLKWGWKGALFWVLCHQRVSEGPLEVFRRLCRLSLKPGSP